jgi:hypothetical protein
MEADFEWDLVGEPLLAWPTVVPCAVSDAEPVLV